MVSLTSRITVSSRITLLQAAVGSLLCHLATVTQAAFSSAVCACFESSTHKDMKMPKKNHSQNTYTAMMPRVLSVLSISVHLHHSC